MRILMMTNTYLPHVGGVARSVAAFSERFRALGHEVLVVAPEFDGQDAEERDVVRVAAVQNFNGSDFSLMLPDSGVLAEATERFQPHIIHAHHPFLMGSAALRVAARLARPLVFTHHTMYEQYTHYAPGDSPLLKRFVAMLSTHYANACQRVFAPSESVARLLAERGVETPVDVLPTGVRTELFARGDGRGLRAALDLPRDAYVVGHVGRLAPEKNLDFLGTALVGLLEHEPRAVALVIGGGPCQAELRALFRTRGLAARSHVLGAFDHPLLASAYRAMDAFAFASHSETQGMVLTEAMAAGVPVIALDAPGAREVVRDGVNGRLLASDATTADFVAALDWHAAQDAATRQRLRRAARATAQRFSLDACARRALECYAEVSAAFQAPPRGSNALLDEVVARIGAEWLVFKGIAGAAGRALAGEAPVGLTAANDV